MNLVARPSLLDLAAAPSSVALDLACGQGRHSVALAQKGFVVVAMDIARSALDHVRDCAAAGYGDAILPVQGDTDAWPFAAAVFDLIVQVDFLDRALYPRLREALRDGGMLLIDTFLDQGRPNAEGPTRSEFLLTRGELPLVFDDFEILRYEEEAGPTARAVFLARKRGGPHAVRETAPTMRAR